MIIKNEDHKWIYSMGITLEDAVRLSRELLERCPKSKKGVSRLNYCRKIIEEGDRAVKEEEQTVTLREAVEVSLREREGRRPSTRRELHYVSKRILQSQTRIASKPLRSIKPSECQGVLSALFPTPRQFNKGRTVLHSVFACGERHGWCKGNPIKAIPKMRLRETEIEALPWEEIGKLLGAVQESNHRSLAPVLGLMLWAGIRPTEAQRIQWEDINWEEGDILLPARHSKTGGARCITLQPVLERWLVKVCGGKGRQGDICPENWNHKWQKLRRDAGMSEWQQDVLRHTFASYHLKHFRDLSQLQIEMGHSTSHLLRTRYLNMRGITREHARLFWSPREWC